MSLEVEQNIREAWLRVRNEILDDPDELHRRLARRRSRTLTQPPRPWCIAVRACDRRITPAHWVITPEHAMDLDHPEHPYEPIEHEVTIQTHAIQHFCRPIAIGKPAERVDVVARRLGVRPNSLRHARLSGIYHENFKKGLGGRRTNPVPLIYREEMHDPGSGCFYRPPQPIWGMAWAYLSTLFPEGFEQTVIRRPVFAKRGKTACPTGEVYKDDMQFMGWRWLCPGCRKPARTIFYPIPVLTLFDRWVSDPVMEKKLADADGGAAPAPTFACYQCHRVRFFSSVHRDAWNAVVSYLTAGLLYGCEVQKPADFVPQRRRTRIRQLHREAPLRRKVLARLSNGWSNCQIARDLAISLNAVGKHVRFICDEEDVLDRHALAQKLNFAVSPPPNKPERAMTRRFAVRQMLLENCSLREMCSKLSASRPVIVADISKIYNLYGIKGRLDGRRALARKLGVPFMTRWDQLREKIAQLRDSGMLHSQIAKELRISTDSVGWHLAKLKKARLLEAAAEAAGAGTTQPATTS